MRKAFAWTLVRLVVMVMRLTAVTAFAPLSQPSAVPSGCHFSPRQYTLLAATSKDSKSREVDINDEKILGPLAATDATELGDEEEEGKAATRTVNDRLLAELEQAADKEKFGARSSMGKKLGLDSFRSAKTDAERKAAIQEARDLNGVNPLVALGGSLFAFAAAAGLWTLTSYLAEYFALHPVDSEVYFVARVTSVFRNVVIGFVSLASGFFGVTGFGIFLLAVRVAYGVFTGELDPTPLKSSVQANEEIDVPNVWDLMMNKKPSRRRRGKGDNDDSSS